MVPKEPWPKQAQCRFLFLIGKPVSPVKKKKKRSRCLKKKERENHRKSKGMSTDLQEKNKHGCSVSVGS